MGAFSNVHYIHFSTGEKAAQQNCFPPYKSLPVPPFQMPRDAFAFPSTSRSLYLRVAYFFFGFRFTWICLKILTMWLHGYQNFASKKTFDLLFVNTKICTFGSTFRCFYLAIEERGPIQIGQLSIYKRASQ